MLQIIFGTDTKKALETLNKIAAQKKRSIVRITDAATSHDLRAALGGGGMFGEQRVIILDRLSDNDDLWKIVFELLPHLAKSEEDIYIYEEKPPAATKRLLEKYADRAETFDLPKSAKERPSVFGMVNAMKAGDKKGLWVAYQQELVSGNAPEAVHGVLFWGAKQALLGARNAKEIEKGKKLIIELTELPHEARRHGEELEYALERFVLEIA